MDLGWRPSAAAGTRINSAQLAAGRQCLKKIPDNTMKPVIYILCIAAFSLGLPPAGSAEKPPNIVFFLVDDMGWGDIGAYGSNYHQTPNIDRLSAGGMKFTNGYAACTVCSPSRAAIITGCYPGRLHLTDWIAGHGKRNPRLNIPKWQMYIDHQRVTLAEAMQQGGYRTMFAGKWHLMPNNDREKFPQHTPTRHGFDINVGGREWGQPKGPGKYFHPFGMPNLKGSPGDFLTDRLTDESIGFIEDNKDRPFFLYLSYYAVHGPLMTRKPLLEKYKTRSKDSAPGGKPWTGRVTPVYAGMIESVDESVGRIMDKLAQLEIDSNTVVIFTADNGGTSQASSGGLRGAKATAWEGGVREPFIIKWPGVVLGGSITDSLAIGTDFYPTILEMAGLPPRPDQHLDGVSLVPVLKKDTTMTDRTLYWHYPHYHKTNPYGAIRDGHWRLVEFFEDGALHLFNLKADPAEARNLAGTMPGKTAELHGKLAAWRKSVDAQMPTPNPDYQPDAGAGKKKTR
jgi:arylsulfatase A